MVDVIAAVTIKFILFFVIVIIEEKLRSISEKLFFTFFCFVALRPKSTAMVMVGTVSSPNHTFSWASLNKQIQYFVHILSLVTDNNPFRMIQRKGGE